jgi:hypothetical protein
MRIGFPDDRPPWALPPPLNSQELGISSASPLRRRVCIFGLSISDFDLWMVQPNWPGDQAPGLTSCGVEPCNSFSDKCLFRVKIDRSMKSYRRTSSAAPRKVMRDQFIERLVTIALQRSEAINIKERPDAATLHEPGHTTFFAASEVEEQPPAS